MHTTNLKRLRAIYGKQFSDLLQSFLINQKTQLPTKITVTMQLRMFHVWTYCRVTHESV